MLIAQDLLFNVACYSRLQRCHMLITLIAISKDKHHEWKKFNNGTMIKKKHISWLWWASCYTGNIPTRGLVYYQAPQRPVMGIMAFVIQTFETAKKVYDVFAEPHTFGTAWIAVYGTWPSSRFVWHGIAPLLLGLYDLEYVVMQRHVQTCHISLIVL